MEADRRLKMCEARVKSLEKQVDFISKNYVTGLYGRHTFMNDLRKKFKTRQNFFLIMYDVDGLHEVNRIKGYAAGDSLLREVANDLQMCEQPCCVYHIGGDEFYAISGHIRNDYSCENTSSAHVESNHYSSVDEMLDSVDKRLSAVKAESKKRRRDDV